MRTRYGIWSSVIVLVMCLSLGEAVVAPQAVYAEPTAQWWRIKEVDDRVYMLENVRLTREQGLEMRLDVMDSDGNVVWVNVNDRSNSSSQKWRLHNVGENVYLLENDFISVGDVIDDDGMRVHGILSYKWDGSYYVARLEPRQGKRGSGKQRWRFIEVDRNVLVLENIGLSQEKGRSMVLDYASGSPNFKAYMTPRE